MGIKHKIETEFQCDAADCKETAVEYNENPKRSGFVAANFRGGAATASSVLCPKHNEELHQLLVKQFGFSGFAE